MIPETIQTACAGLYDGARDNLARDGRLLPVFFLFLPSGRVAGLMPGPEIEKEQWAIHVHKAAVGLEAIAVLSILESWCTVVGGVRSEVVSFGLSLRTGAEYVDTVPISRDMAGRPSIPESWPGFVEDPALTIEGRFAGLCRPA